VRHQIPLASAVYIYGYEEAEFWYLNADVRIAGAFSHIIFDLSAGAEIPDKKNDTTLFSINDIQPRINLSLLLGDQFTASLLVQTGVVDFWFRSAKPDSFSLDNLFLLAEARFSISLLNFHFTGFSLPQTIYEPLFYIMSPYGVSAAIFVDLPHTGYRESKTGAHLTLSIHNDQTVIATGESNSQYDLLLSPFFSILFPNGIFTVTARFDMMHPSEWHKTFAIKASLCAIF
jgi:hypothetical protein